MLYSSLNLEDCCDSDPLHRVYQHMCDKYTIMDVVAFIYSTRAKSYIESWWLYRIVCDTHNMGSIAVQNAQTGNHPQHACLLHLRFPVMMCGDKCCEQTNDIEPRGVVAAARRSAQKHVATNTARLPRPPLARKNKRRAERWVDGGPEALFIIYTANMIYSMYL